MNTQNPNQDNLNIHLIQSMHHHRGRDIDFITKPPAWLIRSGMSILFIGMLGLLAFAHYFRYPEKISGTGFITSDVPPIDIVSKAGGRIEEILVKNQTQVSAGQTIATIHQNADVQDLEAIKTWVTDAKNQEIPALLQYPIPSNLQLGTLQATYSSLQLKYGDYKLFHNDKTYQIQISTLDREIKTLEKLIQSTTRELALYDSEMKLNKTHLNRSEKMHTDKLISTVDWETTQKDMLAKERTRESLSNSRVQNEVRMNQIRYEQSQILKTRNDQNLIKISELRELINTLHNDLNTWQDTYTITAPIDGEVYLPGDLKPYRPINQGDHIAYLLPKQHTTRHITTQVPVTAYGKLETNQKTLIKFDPYPYKEFGLLTSTVTYKDLLPSKTKDGNTYYEVKIALPDTLTTDHGHHIPYQPYLPCTVEIITKDKSLLQRILHNLTSALRNE